jgi:predicted GIY-YIG superfamily endonuclease
MVAEKFFVKILQSMKDSSFYVGQCDDLDKRMLKHGDGMSKYTAAKRPSRLVYFEMFNSRSDAKKLGYSLQLYFVDQDTVTYDQPMDILLTPTI